MANAFRANKDRVVLSAGETITPQTSNPIASADYGLWVDSATKAMNFSSAGSAYALSTMAGVIPSSRMAFSVNPTANDTIAIGGTTFKFVSSLGAAVAQVQVKIGASAAATLASTVKAINGTAAPAEWTEATTPFAGTVLADASTATTLRIRFATARGGTAIAGAAGSTALTASITTGASAWTIDNLNLTGKKQTDVLETCGTVTLSAAMISALSAGIFIELPFTPTVFAFQITDSTGAMRNTVTDTMTISGNALVLTSGGATHVVATNVLQFWASS